MKAGKKRDVWDPSVWGVRTGEPKTGCQSDHTQSPLSLDDFTAHLHARPCYMKSPAAETKDELP